MITSFTGLRLNSCLKIIFQWTSNFPIADTNLNFNYYFLILIIPIADNTNNYYWWKLPISDTNLNFKIFNRWYTFIDSLISVKEWCISFIYRLPTPMFINVGSDIPEHAGIGDSDCLYETIDESSHQRSIYRL